MAEDWDSKQVGTRSMRQEATTLPAMSKSLCQSKILKLNRIQLLKFSQLKNSNSLTIVPTQSLIDLKFAHKKVTTKHSFLYKINCRKTLHLEPWQWLQWFSGRRAHLLFLSLNPSSLFNSDKDCLKRTTIIRKRSVIKETMRFKLF